MISRITAAFAARLKALQEKEKGFTLIELLVVVIIIGVLAAIAIPIYIGVQNNAKDSAVQSDLTNSKIAAVAFYTNDNNAALPTLSSLGDQGYTESVEYGVGSAVAPEFATGSTTSKFCISATSETAAVFHVTSKSGVESGVCPASTTW